MYKFFYREVWTITIEKVGVNSFLAIGEKEGEKTIREMDEDMFVAEDSVKRQIDEVEEKGKQK